MIFFVRFWSFFLCFVGLFLLLVHCVSGQGVRELIDMTPKQSQPTPLSLPGRTQPSILPPTLPSSFPNSETPKIPGLTEGGFPILNNELTGRFLMNAPVQFPPSGTSGTETPPVSTPPKQPLDRIMSVLEEETEDEQAERELLFQRQRAEQIADPERRKAEMERVTNDETTYRNWQTRRQAEEIGADVFYFPHLKDQYLREGWCQLFDGHTDFGWKIQTEGPYAGGQFTFGQNEICSDPYHPGLIYTTIPFGDVTVRFDFCAEKDSEVFLLMKTPPDPEDLNSSCYAFILNSAKTYRPRGLLLGRHGLTLAELRMMREMHDNPTNDDDEVWYSVTVKCEGNDSQFWMNKRSPKSYFDPTPIQSGHIAFLVAKGKVRFQNILWQPSPAVSIFDTENVGRLPWRISEGTEFVGNNSSEAGYRLSNGSVESKEFYGNFVMQMRYYQGTNSGRSSLFIRPLPGQANTGYEVSLQNFPKRQDREAVVGVDAGSFRQIKSARYVRAQDQQWTYLTVAAVDRQLHTWVNGVPVCEIHDRRRVQNNSLIGPFLNPGPIRLSVPPENTLFEFRQLTVSPILMQSP